MRILLILFGLVLGALGGVVAYRAAFLEPATAVVFTEREAHEVSNVPRIVGGWRWRPRALCSPSSARADAPEGGSLDEFSRPTLLFISDLNRHTSSTPT